MVERDEGEVVRKRWKRENQGQSGQTAGGQERSGMAIQEDSEGSCLGEEGKSPVTEAAPRDFFSPAEKCRVP